MKAYCPNCGTSLSNIMGGRCLNCGEELPGMNIGAYPYQKNEYRSKAEANIQTYKSMPQRMQQKPIDITPAKYSGLCVAGFVLSFFPFLNLLGLILSIIGVILASSNKMRGTGLGIAGIVISGIGTLVSLNMVL